MNEKTRCKKVGRKEFLTEEELREHLQYFLGRKVYVYLKENGLEFQTDGMLYYEGMGKYSVEIVGYVKKMLYFNSGHVVEVNGQEIRLSIIGG